MFDLFKRKTAKDFMQDARETYGLPQPKEIPSMPPVPPNPEKDDARIFYRFGVTDKNRVAFSMGYSEITMNKAGCQQMIDQLTFFMNQIGEEETDETDEGTE